jgi:hypothetical protein
VVGKLVRHGSDDAQLIGHTSGLSHQFAEFHTRHRGGNSLKRTSNFRHRLRLRIPQINLTESTLQHHEDTAALAGCTVDAVCQGCRRAENTDRADSQHLAAWQKFRSWLWKR